MDRDSKSDQTKAVIITCVCTVILTTLAVLTFLGFDKPTGHRPPLPVPVVQPTPVAPPPPAARPAPVVPPLPAVQPAPVTQTPSSSVTHVGGSIRVRGVTLDKDSLMLVVGGWRGLSVTIEPSNADTRNVTWSSSNERIATVSSSGLVTAVSPGTATITARTLDGGHTARCIVTVVR